jgi:hypothetical protein
MARAELRIEFLNTLFKLTGRPCQIQIDQTKGEQSAIFAGSDLPFNNIAVEQLQSALGVQPTALIRRTDIRSITFDV